MTNRFFLGAVGILLITGCPTRTVYYDAGTEAAGGETRDAGAGASGGAIGSSGSHGGVAGENGFTGVAGTSSGGGSVAGNGGAIGAASGHSGGPGGASGGVGATGAGGTASAGASGGSGPPTGGMAGGDPYARGYVVCGAVTACPLANGGRCCYAEMDQSSACQVAGATCEPVMASAGTYYAKTTVQCDSTSDCPAPQICCYTEVYIGRSTACADPSTCVDQPTPGPGGYATHRRQVCDPNTVAPTECLSGTCKVATTYSPALPPFIYLCL